MTSQSLSSVFEAELSSISSSISRYIVAFSGGRDSSVLLDLLVSSNNAASAQYRPILVWHINHGLQKNASQMESFCQRTASQYGIEFRSDRLDLSSVNSNIEQACRDNRYRLFNNAIQTNEVLLMAHHADDQAETFLLNAFRGAGVTGLQGMPKTRPIGRGLLCRPLLNCSQDEIKRYAKSQNLEWIEDPSNQSLDFDRNYLRHRVMPDIRTRWPAVHKSLSNSCVWQQEAQELINELAEQDYRQARVESIWCNQVLCLVHLNLLSEVRQKNLIRFLLRKQSLKALSARKLAILIEQLKGSKSGQAIIDSDGFSLRFYDEKLFLVVKPVQLTDVSHELDSFQRKSIFEFCKIADIGQALELKIRNDIDDSAYSHRLKRLFQRNKVPPWQRQNVMLIFIDRQLVSILQPGFFAKQGGNLDSRQ